MFHFNPNELSSKLEEIMPVDRVIQTSVQHLKNPVIPCGSPNAVGGDNKVKVTALSSPFSSKPR